MHCSGTVNVILDCFWIAPPVEAGSAVKNNKHPVEAGSAVKNNKHQGFADKLLLPALLLDRFDSTSHIDQELAILSRKLRHRHFRRSKRIDPQVDIDSI